MSVQLSPSVAARPLPLPLMGNERRRRLPARCVPRRICASQHSGAHAATAASSAFGASTQSRTAKGQRHWGQCAHPRSESRQPQLRRLLLCKPGAYFRVWVSGRGHRRRIVAAFSHTSALRYHPRIGPCPARDGGPRKRTPSLAGTPTRAFARRLTLQTALQGAPSVVRCAPGPCACKRCVAGGEGCPRSAGGGWVLSFKYLPVTACSAANRCTSESTRFRCASLQGGSTYW